MDRIKLFHSYNYIISIENLLSAWKDFVKGKSGRKDVQEFEFHLMKNIISLHNDLIAKTYIHGNYQAFKICDPKPRDIHKASVRDRLLHHAIYRVLYPFFDKIFISDSFSCRINKGTHKAINRFRYFVYKESNNNTKTCWVLKCDIKRFFASIDQKILIGIMKDFIPDKNTIWLISHIINSFYSTKRGKGLPLGNLTSQLLVNIYMNKFDQFVKYKLRTKYYIRYSDDFVIINDKKERLESLVSQIDRFLKEKLKLFLHQDKIEIRKHHQGIDFLGYVSFPHHRVLRTKTKRRALRKVEQKIRELKENQISKESFNQTIQSYVGILKHCNAYKVGKKLKEALKILGK